MQSGAMSRRLLVGGGASFLGLLSRPALAADAGLSRAWAELVLEDEDGAEFRVADLDAPLKLVKLWAHWCPGCLAEIASLTGSGRALSRQGVSTLFVSQAEDWARDREVAHRYGLPFRLARPSPHNASGTVASALLDRGGGFVVPRALLFRGGDALVWNRIGATDWAHIG